MGRRRPTAADHVSHRRQPSLQLQRLRPDHR
ncbi:MULTISPECIES: hypothetical protein [unclassified Pseudomonas]|nr:MULTISPECIES: hypothetical protein [unclassified Pseudomonas]